ncbi:hypothetical protein Pyn_36996 [Prunus yedoensis var. nudiflora]|uniref:SPX domain-containing protein n=1 Tax=Prunus yedoensis var. nudiflora TaxID=2094558 RepID=A0A314XME6_PRUYE|nr:hypothetical protein Pyn_36996 [Prunus yedoensis var. nudiflora]
MVAFGKKLRESQIQEWQGYYLDYKLMKKKLSNRYTQQIEVGTQNRHLVLKDFSILLDSEIEKIVMFLLQQQGVLASKLLNLGEQYDSVLHRFTDYYVKTRANHPYSQLRQVCKQVGVGAVVGAISRNLADLQDFQQHYGNYISIYDQPAFSHPDPVLDSIRAAVNRLSNSTSFLHYLGKHALLMGDDLQSPSEDHADDGSYHFMSLLLNLANTFLYMVNTYIIVPTADNYSMTLGAAATVCGVVIGSMAVAQVFSSVYFSAWSNRSYMRPLVFSSIILLVGNTLYALAYDLNSISVLLIGRLFCGLGSARAVNRRYISDCVPLKLRMQASAGFVSAGALGMACGPALACLLQTNFKIYKLTFNEDTLPGWIMALAWLIYLLWLSISFKEPSRVTTENIVPRESNSGKIVNISVENGPTQPLLSNSKAKQKDGDGDTDCDDAEEDPAEIQKPVNSIVSAYRLLTPSVKCGNLSCMSRANGFPVNVVVGSYISNMFEERQVLLASEILVCIGILLSFHVLIPYSVPQYVSSALITFVSAEVLEGVNLSLLSRVMSSRLSRGTYNGGLLSTEAGTLARVIADGTITLAGFWGESKLLNTTLVPALFICVSSLLPPASPTTLSTDFHSFSVYSVAK